MPLDFVPAYGWRQPDLPVRTSLPRSAPPGGWAGEVNIDLRPHVPAIRNQQWLGACTGFALTHALSYALGRAGADGLAPTPQLADAVFSPLWLYGRERDRIGMFNLDSGAPLLVGLDVMRTEGCATEARHPYIPEQYAVRPPADVNRDARLVRVVNSEHLPPDADTLLATLAAGFPFVFGVTTFDTFESAPGGEVPFPGNRDTVRGGHALFACGAYRSRGEYRVRFANSWGEGYGELGFGSLPLRYLTDPGLCGERAVIRVVGWYPEG